MENIRSERNNTTKLKEGKLLCPESCLDENEIKKCTADMILTDPIDDYAT